MPKTLTEWICIVVFGVLMHRLDGWKDKAGLKSGLTSYVPGLQRRPAKVRGFFTAPTVRYAA